MTDGNGTLNGEVDAEPQAGGPQSCYFWDIRKRECHFEVLVLGCTPCAACPG